MCQFEEAVHLIDDATNKSLPRTYQIVRQVKDICIKIHVQTVTPLGLFVKYLQFNLLPILNKYASKLLQYCLDQSLSQLFRTALTPSILFIVSSDAIF